MSDEPPQDAAPARLGPLAPIAFLLTIVTTIYAGASLSVHRGTGPLSAWPAGAWWDGLVFSTALLVVLAAHEAGHMWAAKREGVWLGWPIFLPSIPPLGTLGAVLQAPDRPLTRSAWVRIAAGGPLGGLVLLLPIALVGVAMSEVRPLPIEEGGWMQLGTPLLFGWMERWFHGPIPAGHDVFLHPLAFAAWVGFLVTALNLLPVAQLDGGHLVHGLIGGAARWVNWLVWGGLVVLGWLAYPGWWVLVLLLFVVLGVEHPQRLTPGPGITPGERWLALVTLCWLPLTFVPQPLLAIA